MADDRKPRAKSMGDVERALVGREHRSAPAAGVPIHAPEPDDFTPVGDVLAMTDNPELRAVIAAIWRHTANEGMRMRRRSDSQETATLRRELDELCERTGAVERAVIDIHGASGRNGKVGNLGARIDELKKQVEKADGRRWQLTMWAAGLIVTVITSAFVLGKWIGSVESDVAALKARGYRHHVSQPDAPAKETP